MMIRKLVRSLKMVAKKLKHAISPTTGGMTTTMLLWTLPKVFSVRFHFKKQWIIECLF